MYVIIIIIKSPYCPCPELVCRGAYFGSPIDLNYKYTLPGSPHYNSFKLLVELLDLLGVMV